MASSRKLPEDRRTISCPTVPSAAKLEASTVSRKDAPPDYDSLPSEQQTQHSPSYPTASYTSDGAAPSPTSPVARAFFATIKQHVRSRSRSLSCSREPSPSPSARQDGATTAREPNLECAAILGSGMTRTASPTAMTPQPIDTVPPKKKHSNSMPVRPSARGGSRSGSGSGSGSRTITQCGRHSNEWLFHNVSLTDTVKGMLDKRRS